MFKLKKYLICLLTVLFTFNFVLADSTTDVFIKNQIENVLPSEFCGYHLSEELKRTARYYFRLGKDEEILYAYSTAFWDNSEKISQGCVITDQSINFVLDNDKVFSLLK